MNLHTAGEWVWDGSYLRAVNPSPTNAVAVIITDFDCMVYRDVTTEAMKAEIAANKAVLAAAPLLLEACQTFAEWLRREESGFPAAARMRTPDGEREWRAWFDENLRLCDLAQKQARAAIAKATNP